MYERFDGKGFPLGLAGKDIPLGARILAVADAYADLTQNPRNPARRMLNAGGYGTGARWFLDAAVEHNDIELTEWSLSHGANPNAAPGPGRRNRQRPLYEEAMFRGHVEVAELLVRYGAPAGLATTTPDGRLWYVAAPNDNQTASFLSARTLPDEAVRKVTEALEAKKPIPAGADFVPLQ